MKNILIATNFSPASQNATDFIIKNINTKEDKVFLFHTIHTDVGNLTQPYIEEVRLMKLSAQQSMNDEVKRLSNSIVPTRKLQLVPLIEQGPFEAKIEELITALQINLLVLGSTKEESFLNTLVGDVHSRTRAMGIETLIVPLSAKPKFVSNILYATRPSQKAKADALDTLADFAKSNEAKVVIADISPKIDTGDFTKIGLFKSKFRDVHHTYNCYKDESAKETMEVLSVKHNADLIAILPQNRNIISQITSSSLADSIMVEQNKPVLILSK